MTSKRIGRLDANAALQAVLAIVCVCVLLIRLDAYGTSEFSGGWLAGRLFQMADAGSALFALAIVATFFYRRIAAGLELLASLICAPLYVYVLAPALYRSIFDGESSVRQWRFFVWDNWAAAGLTALFVTAVASVRVLLPPSVRSPKSED